MVKKSKYQKIRHIIKTKAMYETVWRNQSYLLTIFNFEKEDVTLANEGDF